MCPLIFIGVDTTDVQYLLKERYYTQVLGMFIFPVTRVAVLIRITLHPNVLRYTLTFLVITTLYVTSTAHNEYVLTHIQTLFLLWFVCY